MEIMTQDVDEREGSPEDGATELIAKAWANSDFDDEVAAFYEFSVAPSERPDEFYCGSNGW